MISIRDLLPAIAPQMLPGDKGKLLRYSKAAINGGDFGVGETVFIVSIVTQSILPIVL
jgi:hypothetical protein